MTAAMNRQPADPAHRHGGPDAGWYIPDGHGWQRISDAEVSSHGDAAHFMSDPNGRHTMAPAKIADAVTLERAAEIIAERSTKPNAVATRAMVKVLQKQAAVIRRELDHGQVKAPA